MFSAETVDSVRYIVMRLKRDAAECGDILAIAFMTRSLDDEERAMYESIFLGEMDRLWSEAKPWPRGAR